MKITKTQEKKLAQKLAHITGECMCSPNSKTCVYWKNVDKGGDDWQVKEIIKIIKEIFE